MVKLNIGGFILRCIGVWAVWSLWSACTRTCGGGVRVKIRGCSGDYCPGSNTQTESCNALACGGRYDDDNLCHSM